MHMLDNRSDKSGRPPHEPIENYMTYPEVNSAMSAPIASDTVDAKASEQISIDDGIPF